MKLDKSHVYIMPAALGALLLWAYVPVLSATVGKWSSAEYSHGYFVPAFALALLWLRRSQIATDAISPSWWGLVPLALGSGLRVAGAYYYMEYLEMLSLLPCLVGISICVGGNRVLYWSLPSIAFLFFMMPLPYTLEVMLAGPLRRVAVIASTYTLQTFGFSAVADGNIILMESQPILVAEACSGLSMLLTFFALSTGLALVVNRFIVDKIVIVISALPIAIIANLIRIVSTAILAETVGSQAANVVFHDLAGWLMMPLALSMLALELFIIDKLFIKRPDAAPSASPFDGFGQYTAAVAPISAAASPVEPQPITS